MKCVYVRNYISFSIVRENINAALYRGLYVLLLFKQVLALTAIFPANIPARRVSARRSLAHPSPPPPVNSVENRIYGKRRAGKRSCDQQCIRSTTRANAKGRHVAFYRARRRPRKITLWHPYVIALASVAPTEPPRVERRIYVQRPVHLSRLYSACIHAAGTKRVNSRGPDTLFAEYPLFIIRVFGS